MQLRPILASSLIAFTGFATALYAFVPASDADKVFVGNVSQGGCTKLRRAKLPSRRRLLRM
jgi:hypothetical protein